MAVDLDWTAQGGLLGRSLQKRWEFSLRFTMQPMSGVAKKGLLEAH
jgi:hypothetical protein